MPKAAELWTLSLREKLIKVGAKVVSHGRYVTLQMAEVTVSRQMIADIVALIAQLRAPPARRREGELGQMMRQTTTAKVRLEAGKATRFSASAKSTDWFNA